MAGQRQGESLSLRGMRWRGRDEEKKGGWWRNWRTTGACESYCPSSEPREGCRTREACEVLFRMPASSQRTSSMNAEVEDGMCSCTVRTRSNCSRDTQ